MTKENGIPKNAAIAVPLKYQCNFWRSFEMPLIKCKVKIKLHEQNVVFQLCFFVIDNTNANPENIIFTIKDVKLCVPVVALSVKDN